MNGILLRLLLAVGLSLSCTLVAIGQEYLGASSFVGAVGTPSIRFYIMQRSGENAYRTTESICQMEGDASDKLLVHNDTAWYYSGSWLGGMLSKYSIVNGRLVHLKSTSFMLYRDIDELGKPKSGRCEFSGVGPHAILWCDVVNLSISLETMTMTRMQIVDPFE